MPNEFNLNIMTYVPYWWDRVSPLFEEFSQRMLVVADGELNFNPESGFGLSRFIDELAKATPAPVITKAHRGADPTADKPNFVFDESVKLFDPSTNTGYDQIWLFGAERESGKALFDSEFKVLADFMIAGGGLFATGDHEDLGFAMCGDLPRVRKMRDWRSFSTNKGRIDTVTNPGPDRLPQFDDQSDEFPQRIFPHYFKSGASFLPHALLRSPNGDIDVMPDHSHESVCLVGQNLGENYTRHGLNIVEFPPFNGSPLAPEIIASAISAGRFVALLAMEPTPHLDPTNPLCFDSISVWNGDDVGQGRIVCDSSFHHFTNINLDGKEAGAGTGNNNRRGLRDANGNFTEDFHQIAQYYRNIARWLAPVGRREMLLLIDIIIERYRYPLIEEWKPLPLSSDLWESRVNFGARVEAVLNKHHGRGYNEQLVTAVLEAAGLKEFAEFVRPVRPEIEARNKFLRLLISPDELRHGVIGSLFDAVARHLPVNPSELAEVLDKKNFKRELLIEEANNVARSAIEDARSYLEDSIQRTRIFLL